jgi:hypothetical protein
MITKLGRANLRLIVPPYLLTQCGPRKQIKMLGSLKGIASA